MSFTSELNFNGEDLSQIIIGAFALAVPISFSEEAWRLGETLPIANLIVTLLISVGFIAFFAYQSVFQGNIQKRITVFLFRVLAAYALSFFVVALVLLALDKLPLLSEPTIALKRLIVIAMPASMGAIVVDSFDKE